MAYENINLMGKAEHTVKYRSYNTVMVVYKLL